MRSPASCVSRLSGVPTADSPAPVTCGSPRTPVQAFRGPYGVSAAHRNADQDPGAGETVMGLNPSHFSPARTSRDWINTGSGCSPTRRATSLPAPSEKRNVGTPSTPFLAAASRPTAVDTSTHQRRRLCCKGSLATGHTPPPRRTLPSRPTPPRCAGAGCTWPRARRDRGHRS